VARKLKQTVQYHHLVINWTSSSTGRAKDEDSITKFSSLFLICIHYDKASVARTLHFTTNITLYNIQQCARQLSGHNSASNVKNSQSLDYRNTGKLFRDWVSKHRTVNRVHRKKQTGIANAVNYNSSDI
jgi:hypothetical protein